VKFQIEEKGAIGEPTHRIAILVEVKVDDLVAMSSTSAAGTALEKIRIPHPASQFRGAAFALEILSTATELGPPRPSLGPLFDGSRPKARVEVVDRKSRAAGERATDAPEKTPARRGLSKSPPARSPAARPAKKRTAKKRTAKK